MNATAPHEAEGATVRRAVRTVAGELSALRRRGGIAGSGPVARWLVVVGAVVVAGLGVMDLVQHYDIGVPVAVGLSVLRALGLLAMLRWPVGGWWAVVVGCVVTTASTTPVDAEEPWPWAVTSVLAFVLGLVALAPRVHRATAVTLWVLVQALGLVLSPFGAAASASRWTSFLGTAIFTGVALVIVDAVSGRRRAESRLLVVEQESRGERERRRLLEERTRIARELHDVVAHHMSVITVQADSAAYRIDGLGDTAREEFASIAGSSRTALEEMRRVLEVLRAEPAGSADLAPYAGVGSIGSLAHGVERVGVRARVRVDDRLGDGSVPPEVGLAVYRVVQEALSNVVRHAPGADADVAVRRDGPDLRVEVRNGPGGPAGAFESARRGRGLDGMTERLESLGGTMSAETTNDGGFVVRATLPLDRT